jgi:regulator of protease activity HflC (stomatin/prohibitin superfamily)
VYRGGRHVVAPWSYFLTFPATLINIEWLAADKREAVEGSSALDLAPMDMRTSEGNMMTLSLALQYTINPDTLGDMYLLYKDGVQQNFVTKLRAGFGDYISTRKSAELWENRAEVTDGLLATCHRVAKDQLKAFVKCWQLQFLGVKVQDSVEDAFTRQQVQNQRQKYEMKSQQAQKLRAATKVIESEYDRNISIVKSSAEAQAYNLVQQATSDAALKWAEARAAALKTIRDGVAVSATPAQGTTAAIPAVTMTPAQIIKYLEKVSLISSPSSAMTYGDFSSAVIFANSEL